MKLFWKFLNTLVLVIASIESGTGLCGYAVILNSILRQTVTAASIDLKQRKLLGYIGTEVCTFLLS